MNINDLWDLYLHKTNRKPPVDEKSFLLHINTMRQVGWINDAEKRELEENKKRFIPKVI